MRAMRVPGSEVVYWEDSRGRREGMCDWLSGKEEAGREESEVMVSEIWESEAVRKDLHSLLRLSDVKGPSSSGRKGFKGSSCLTSDSISARGLKLTKTSNLVRATAISGLWLGSVNCSGLDL